MGGAHGTRPTVAHLVGHTIEGTFDLVVTFLTLTGADAASTIVTQGASEWRYM